MSTEAKHATHLSDASRSQHHTCCLPVWSLLHKLHLEELHQKPVQIQNVQNFLLGIISPFGEMTAGHWRRHPTPCPCTEQQQLSNQQLRYTGSVKTSMNVKVRKSLNKWWHVSSRPLWNHLIHLITWTWRLSVQAVWPDPWDKESPGMIRFQSETITGTTSPPLVTSAG